MGVFRSGEEDGAGGVQFFAQVTHGGMRRLEIKVGIEVGEMSEAVKQMDLVGRRREQE